MPAGCVHTPGARRELRALVRVGSVWRSCPPNQPIRGKPIIPDSPDKVTVREVTDYGGLEFVKWVDEFGRTCGPIPLGSFVLKFTPSTSECSTLTETLTIEQPSESRVRAEFWT